jgi:hypothetical protein
VAYAKFCDNTEMLCDNLMATAGITLTLTLSAATALLNYGLNLLWSISDIIFATIYP